MSEPCGLWSWGKDAYVLGHTLPPTGASMETKQCLEAKSIHTLKGISLSEICASEKHCLVLTRQGQMYSWGAGTFGRLGHGDKYEQKIPKQILLNNSIRTISCGDAHSAAIDFNGRLYTWGCGYFGRLGHGDETHATSPRMLYVAQLISVSAVACGGSHTLFLNGDGKVFSCGFGKYHQLGHGTPFDSMFPSEISYLASKKIISLAAGTSHSIALSSDGSIYAWGSNEFGQTGLGTKKDQPTPKLVPFEERAYQVRCGDVHTAILTSSGKVYTFGCCENGRLGYNTTKDQLTPRLVSDIVETVVELKAGGCHTAALDDKGQLYIWGWNKYMQLGVTHKSILERGSDELDSDSDSGSDSDSDEGDPYGISTPMILERVTGCHMIACGKYVTLAYLTSAKKVLLQYALDGDKDEVANILRRYNKKELNNLQLVATDLDGNTPLHIASRFGYDGVAQELMQYGWSLSSVNATSRTPIHLAALHGRDKCIRMYSTNQSCEILNQQDSNSKTALHLAVEHGHHECAKILVQQGADPNIPDRNGKTPLHHSAILGHLGTLKFLASSKGDVLIKDSNKKSPLDYLGLEDAFTIKEHIGFADVYISFVADDTAFSRNLSKKLSENFLTSCTLNSSPKQDSLSQMQQEKIQTARAVVFIISKSSINQAKNKISLLELEYAKESDIPVFAIWKDYTILDPHLESLVYRNQILDFSDADRYDERVTQLASGIKLLFLQNQSGKKGASGGSKAASGHKHVTMEGLDAFICHITANASTAQFIQELLEKNSISCSTSESESSSSDILRTTTFILILSPSSVVSSRILDQLSVAENHKKHIIVVQLGKVSLDPAIQFTLARTPFLVLEMKKGEPQLDDILFQEELLSFVSGKVKAQELSARVKELQSELDEIVKSTLEEEAEVAKYQERYRQQIYDK